MDTTALLVGFFEILAAEGVCAWHPDAVYAADEVAAVLESLPDAPDRAIALLTYPYSQLGGGDERIEMQMLTRGTKHPQTVNELHDAAYAVLNGLGGLIGGVRVVDTVIRTATALAPDGNGRRRKSTRFFVTVSHDGALDF